MKKIFLILAAVYCAGSLFAQTPDWRRAGEIVQTIGDFTFSENKEVTIAEKSAKNATKAINSAIATCHKAGGGKVIIPKGEFLTGPIVLLSHVNLHLEEGAVLKFSTDPKDYPNANPMIDAQNQTNIAITGAGKLDGQANASQPAFIRMTACTQVLIETITLNNPATKWFFLQKSEKISVRNLSVESPSEQSTGFVFENCNYIALDNCHFNTAADFMTIKSCENIVLRNGSLQNGRSGITIVGDSAKLCGNVFVEAWNMEHAKLRNIVHIQSNTEVGGKIENIFMRNIKTRDCSDAVIKIELNSEKGTNNPVLHNLVFERITAKSASYGVLMQGFKDICATKLILKNCSFERVKNIKINELFGAKDITFQNVTFSNDANFKPAPNIREMTPEQRKELMDQRRQEMQERRKLQQQRLSPSQR